MSVVSAVVYYGQQNLDRFNSMAEYWRRAMLPDERERTFFLSAGERHVKFADPDTAEKFRGQCWKLSRPDMMSRNLVERMLGMINKEGIQLHIVCGGEDGPDPLAPLRLLADLRKRVSPVVVTAFFYMMVDDTAASMKAQRLLAEQLENQTGSWTLYLLSRRNEIGALLPRFDMDRALTCEILLHVRGLRSVGQRRVYTLGYKSLNAFDSELTTLREIALREAAREVHDGAIHNVDAWQVLFPGERHWQRFLTISDAWRSRFPRADYTSDEDAWQALVPDSANWKKLPAVDAPEFANTASVKEQIRKYLDRVAAAWLRTPNPSQLDNARILAGLRGKEDVDRVMSSVAEFISANTPEEELTRKIDMFCDLLVEQVYLQLCGMLNGTTFPEAEVLIPVIRALEQMSEDKIPMPRLMEAKLGLGQRILPGIARWEKLFQERCAEAAVQYAAYQRMQLVQRMARVLREKFAGEIRLFLQQLKKSDDFNKAINSLRAHDMDEEALKQKYSGYWDDVKIAVRNRQGTLSWPYGPYAGTSDLHQEADVYSSEAVRALVKCRQKIAADLPLEPGEQEKWIREAESFQSDHLRQRIGKESKDLHEEQSAGYSSSFIKAIREMNPGEHDMDEFLNHYLEGGAKMLCMIHLSHTIPNARNYFVDGALGDGEWVREHYEDVLMVQNDNIERIDLFPVEETLSQLLNMQDNNVFGDEETQETAAGTQMTVPDEADVSDEAWYSDEETADADDRRMPEAAAEAEAEAGTGTQVEKITPEKKGQSVWIHWPVPTDPHCGPARIRVVNNGKSQMVLNDSKADVSDLLEAGRNQVEVLYKGQLFARGVVLARLTPLRYSVRTSQKGTTLQLRVPAGARFVLKDETPRSTVVYPIGRTENGVYEQLKLGSRVSVAEIPAKAETGPRFELIRE